MAQVLWLDDYERAARLSRGLIALLPIPILVTAFGLNHNPVAAIVVSLVTAVGGPLVLAKYVRSRGRLLEGKLYTKWGGAPTTLLLTQDSSRTAGALQLQRRANVERVSQQILPATALPHGDREQSFFQAAVSTLRQKTYDQEVFPMVHAENKSYGIERNSLAIRTEGRVISGVGLLVAAGGWGLAASGHSNVNTSALAVATAVIFVVLVFWIFWPTATRVRRAGDVYAEQLLDASGNL